MARKPKTLPLKPCPCCGGTDLWVGVMSATSQGVQCRADGCRLSLSVPVDFNAEGKTPKNETWAVTWRRMLTRTVQAAVDRWNARAVDYGGHFPVPYHLGE